MPRTVLLSPARIRRTMARLAYEVIERNRGVEDLVVFGMRTRGQALAERLAAELSEASGQAVTAHPLAVEAFRDDRPDTDPQPLGPAAPDADGKDVLLVDDVMFTGRTARAAIEAVLRHGRPRSVQLAVLVDRGHREVPIHADYVGRTVPTKAAERVVVDVSEPAVYLEE